MSLTRRTLALVLCTSLTPFAYHRGWAQGIPGGRPPGDADAPEDPARLRVDSASATPWPSFQPSLQPAPSASPVLASLPADVQITPTGGDVPASVRELSGRWIG